MKSFLKNDPLVTCGPQIIAVTKFNDGEAFVLSRQPKLVYQRIGDKTIVGTDGIFCNCYYFESPSKSFQAFGGRKFEILLDNGEIVQCHGQWWSGVTKDAIEHLGGSPVYVTAASIDELRSCYVFCGYQGIPSKIKKLRKTYTGIVYDYWDYRDLMFSDRYGKTPSPAHFKKYKTKRNYKPIFTK